MLHWIDNFLNRMTMYRLTLYYLIGLVVVAFILSFFQRVPYTPTEIVIGTTIVIVVCAVANRVFAQLFRATTNTESVYITALILALIIPLRLPANAFFLLAASGLAMGSKYFFTVEKKHLLNPAAAAVAAIALVSDHVATWWVGTPIMLPFILAGGFLLVRKIQREKMVFTFLGVFYALITVVAFLRHPSLVNVVTNWKLSTIHSALFFFAFVMLTEPLTSPPTKKLQSYYGALVAVLYSTVQYGLFALTPEMALCIGNIFSYIVSPKYRLSLTLKWKQQLSPDTVVFGFEHVPHLAFIPGQYMEWTLPHEHVDNRGNRRYFSFASSPTEQYPMVLVKFYQPSSSYKKALLGLKTGENLIANQLSGDFTLPKNLQTPLVFMAGGVGIAPFRSMLQFIIDQRLQVDIIVLYANKTVEDMTCTETLKAAEPFGVRTIYILTNMQRVPQNWPGLTGHLTAEVMTANIPDYKLRTFYLSGPSAAVRSFHALLKSMEIPNKQIKEDFFPGY